MRVTGFPSIVTQMNPPPKQISPPLPGTCTGITATTLLLAGSIRETLPSDWLSTHSEPAPSVEKRGPSATVIIAVVFLVAGSSRYTFPSPELIAHTDPKAS